MPSQQTHEPDHTCHRGRLISIEGISGVGKTHLTARLLDRPDNGALVLLEEFSQRPYNDGGDLGRDLLGTLVTAAAGDSFLRGGHPGAETLLLLAIKMFDYEHSCAAAIADGHTVIEGRSAHSIAVYQSVITHRDDEHAYQHAQVILDVARAWRPLPDRTILITDDVNTAVRRAEARDGTRYTDEQWQLHHRAAALFDRLASDHPHHITVLDCRRLTTDMLIDKMAHHIDAAPTPCLATPIGHLGAAPRCQPRCRLQQHIR